MLSLPQPSLSLWLGSQALLQAVAGQGHPRSYLVLKPGYLESLGKYHCGPRPAVAWGPWLLLLPHHFGETRSPAWVTRVYEFMGANAACPLPLFLVTHLATCPPATALATGVDTWPKPGQSNNSHWFWDGHVTLAGQGCLPGIDENADLLPPWAWHTGVMWCWSPHGHLTHLVEGTHHQQDGCSSIQREAEKKDEMPWWLIRVLDLTLPQDPPHFSSYESLSCASVIAGRGLTCPGFSEALGEGRDLTEMVELRRSLWIQTGWIHILLLPLSMWPRANHKCHVHFWTRRVTGLNELMYVRCMARYLGRYSPQLPLHPTPFHLPS